MPSACSPAWPAPPRTPPREPAPPSPPGPGFVPLGWVSVRVSCAIGGVGGGGVAGCPDSRLLTAMVGGPGFVRHWGGWRGRCGRVPGFPAPDCHGGRSGFRPPWVGVDPGFVRLRRLLVLWLSLDARARLAVNCRYGLTRCRPRPGRLPAGGTPGRSPSLRQTGHAANGSSQVGAFLRTSAAPAWSRVSPAG